MVHDFFFFNDTATTEIYTLSLHDALPISAYNFAFAIRPLANVSAAQAKARVSLTGDAPFTIFRNSLGVVTLQTPQKGRTVLYSITGGKAPVYTQPFALKQAPTERAWYQEDKARTSVV